MASFAPPAQPKLETTASVPPHSVAAVHPSANTKIIVGTSDTLEVLAHRYHLTPEAILAANGYKGPRRLSPGQSLIIPHPTAAAASARSPSLNPRPSAKRRNGTLATITVPIRIKTPLPLSVV